MAFTVFTATEEYGARIYSFNKANCAMGDIIVAVIDANVMTQFGHECVSAALTPNTSSGYFTNEVMQLTQENF